MRLAGRLAVRHRRLDNAVPFYNLAFEDIGLGVIGELFGAGIAAEVVSHSVHGFVVGILHVNHLMPHNWAKRLAALVHIDAVLNVSNRFVDNPLQFLGSVG